MRLKPYRRWTYMTRVFVAVGEIISWPENCFHKDSECHTCKRKGHISPQCPQKKSAKSPAKGKPKQPKAKQGKKKKKDSKIRLLGTGSGSEREASSSSHYESSGDEYHREFFVCNHVTKSRYVRRGRHVGG